MSTSRVIAINRRLAWIVVTVVCALGPWVKGDSLAFALPEPIQSEDIKLISRWLFLSEAQQMAFDAMLGRYREGHGRLFESRITRIQQLADEGAALVLQNYPPESVVACEKFFDAQDDYLDALAALDATVLAELQTILSEEQQPLIKHVELWRQRRRCLMTGWDLHCAGIDLELLAVSVLPGNDPVALDSIREVLNEYAEAVTQKYVDTDRASTRRALDGVRILADPSIPPEGKAAAISSRTTAVVRREIGLCELNAAFAEKIAGGLPAPFNRTFMEAFLGETLPLSHPDLMVSEASTQMFMASALLTEEQRVDIQARWAVQQASLTTMTEAMVERERRWRESVTMTRTTTGSKEFADFMREKRESRWLLHQQYLRQLLELYASAIPAPEANTIRRDANDISVLVLQSKDDGYPLRRPLKPRGPPQATQPER